MHKKSEDWEIRCTDCGKKVIQNKGANYARRSDKYLNQGADLRDHDKSSGYQMFSKFEQGSIDCDQLRKVKVDIEDVDVGHVQLKKQRNWTHSLKTHQMSKSVKLMTTSQQFIGQEKSFELRDTFKTRNEKLTILSSIN